MSGFSNGAGFSVDLSTANRGQILVHLAALKEDVDRTIASLKVAIQALQKASLRSKADCEQWENFVITEAHKSDVCFNRAMDDVEQIISRAEHGGAVDHDMMEKATDLFTTAGDIELLQRVLKGNQPVAEIVSLQKELRASFPLLDSHANRANVQRGQVQASEVVCS